MRINRQWQKLAFLLLALCISLQPVGAQQGLPADLDDYVARTMKEFDVPGIALAVVKDGRVVISKGYGVREQGKQALVDENTLFGIASNSKAFTTAALAMLVDEGKLSWDDRVIKHLPAFQLYDPYVTREMTVRDLLTHRSGMGLGAGDLMWWPPTDFTREEITRNIRYLKPVTSFRTAYAYDNVLYMVAGEVLKAISGKTWDEFIKERILAPLGMNRSNTSTRDLRPGENVVSAHAMADGVLKAIPFNNLDNIAAAGAINSSVADMTKWMIAQLANGRYRSADGTEKRLFSERQNQQMWSAQTILPINQNPPAQIAALKPNFSAYGLGWGLQDYRGHKIVSHTGGLAGMVSKVTLVPDINLGVVVLTNQEEGGAFSSISWRIVDSYINAPSTDWTKAYSELRKSQLQGAEAAVKGAATKRNADSKPSLPVKSYAGTYRDAWYGDITITESNGRLSLRFNRTPLLNGDMEHWQYDTFIVRWRERSLNADAYVSFSLKPDGSIEQMKMAAVSSLTDFSFDFHDLLFVPVK
jgi:CubicO group peptidase (beta-lactamase class C family)